VEGIRFVRMGGTALKEIWAVGQYALGMSWGDGHNTGIYTFDFLRELGGEPPVLRDQKTVIE